MTGPGANRGTKKPTKKVRVRYTFDLYIDVPDDWEKGNVEFYLNESSSCALNRIRELDEYFGDKCCCEAFDGKVIESLPMQVPIREDPEAEDTADPIL